MLFVKGSDVWSLTKPLAEDGIMTLHSENLKLSHPKREWSHKHQTTVYHSHNTHTCHLLCFPVLTHTHTHTHTCSCSLSKVANRKPWQHTLVPLWSTSPYGNTNYIPLQRIPHERNEQNNTVYREKHKIWRPSSHLTVLWLANNLGSVLYLAETTKNTKKIL